MNTGAEAVESAIKVARRWGYEVEGHPRGLRTDRRDGGQLPRPYDDHRQLLDRRGGAPSLRAVHARLPGGALRRRGRRSRPRSTRPRSRSCSSRSRARPGWSCPPDGFLPQVRALCDERSAADGRRRDPVGPRPHRPDVRVRPRGRRPGHLHPRQGPRRRHLPGLCHRRRPRRPRRDHRPDPMARRSVATRWRPRSGARWSPCCGRGSSRSAPPGSGRSCTRSSGALVGKGVRGGALPRPVGRRGRRPDADDRAGAVRGAAASAACSPRTPTASTLRLAPPLVVTEDDIGFLVDALGECSPTRPSRTRAPTASGLSRRSRRGRWPGGRGGSGTDGDDRFRLGGAAPGRARLEGALRRHRLLLGHDVEAEPEQRLRGGVLGCDLVPGRRSPGRAEVNATPRIALASCS